MHKINVHVPNSKFILERGHGQKKEENNINPVLTYVPNLVVLFIMYTHVRK